MNTARQTWILGVGLAAGIILMLIAYSAEGGGPFGRWTAAVLAAVVILATAAAYWAHKGELDLEKAGDGCYYLGLMFTLVSLIVVLSGFGDANGMTAAERTNEVVAKFGVALVSTGVGVAARVFLQSLAGEEAIDPEDFTPEKARAIYGSSLSIQAQHTLRAMREAEHSFTRLARTSVLHAEAMEHRAVNAGSEAARTLESSLGEMARTVQAISESMQTLGHETRQQSEQVRNATQAANSFSTAAAQVMQKSVDLLEEAKGVAEKTAKDLDHAAEAACRAAGTLRDAYSGGAAELRGAARTRPRAPGPDAYSGPIRHAGGKGTLALHREENDGMPQEAAPKGSSTAE